MQLSLLSATAFKVDHWHRAASHHVPAPVSGVIIMIRRLDRAPPVTVTETGP